MMKTLYAASLFILFLSPAPASEPPIQLTYWEPTYALGTFDYGYGTVTADVYDMTVWPGTLVSQSIVEYPEQGMWVAHFTSPLPAGRPLRLVVTLTRGEYFYITHWNQTF